jgi:hypothetical protein
MLKLILPTIFPSWRFFSSIGASPRIQITLLKTEDSEPEVWQEFRPRPARLTLGQGLLRLIHNPRWNESLYLNTCAERLFEMESPWHQREIAIRIGAALTAGDITTHGEHYWRYRIIAIESEPGSLTETVVLVSAIYPLLRAS